MTGNLNRLIAGLGAALIAASAVVVIAAAGTSSPVSSAAVGTGPVVISNYLYKAASLQVKAGAKVVFVNKDSSEHTATADTGAAFDTGTLAQGKSSTITLNKPGTYAYHCAFHAFMRGTLVVK